MRLKIVHVLANMDVCMARESWHSCLRHAVCQMLSSKLCSHHVAITSLWLLVHSCLCCLLSGHHQGLELRERVAANKYDTDAWAELAQEAQVSHALQAQK